MGGIDVLNWRVKEMTNKLELSHGYNTLNQAWECLNGYLQVAINEERQDRLNCNEPGSEHKHCRCIPCIELKSIRMIDDFRNNYYDKKTIPNNFPTYKDTQSMRANIYRTYPDHDRLNRFGNSFNTSYMSPYLQSRNAVGTIWFNNIKNTGRFGS